MEMSKSFLDYVKEFKLEILDDMGHTPHIENPQLIVSKLKEFLDETDSDINQQESSYIKNLDADTVSNAFCIRHPN